MAIGHTTSDIHKPLLTPTWVSNLFGSQIIAKGDLDRELVFSFISMSSWSLSAVERNLDEFTH